MDLVATRRQQIPDLGDRIRAARKAKGWGQTELGERSGLGQTTISKLERDGTKYPGHDTIVCLERALGITLDVQPASGSFAHFAASELARTLNPPLTDEERRNLPGLRWWDDDALEPNDEEWFDFVRQRRRLRRKR